MVRDFVMYKLSSFTTDQQQSLHPRPPWWRHPRDTAWSSSAPFPSEAISRVTTAILSFDNGAQKPCCFNKARILICHKLKLFLPVNFLIFMFKADISNSSRTPINREALILIYCAEFEIMREHINAKNKTTYLPGSPINWLRPRGREGAFLLWRGKNRIQNRVCHSVYR